MGISRVGPYDGLLAFALNDIELDMLRVKEHAGDAKGPVANAIAPTFTPR
ncbi:UNVERIFIED_ORG: hypothetical protein M2438_005374 [Methylobacterium sp. SuP10 SLI 274]|nr:hypothetical protein [Methylorubrum extorquens]MDF9861038.1 hypothetical protein [Methylorubrum pseudosasae]MDH6640128.1 hypothetical protein [Methylobacterium sp. SuP10 SLI 274]MDH6669289.1 hypothetical protein [Methylorubrum zatmanii]MCP1556697.1 hypothetical protein [Methylorubrum extorquens]